MTIESAHFCDSTCPRRLRVKAKRIGFVQGSVKCSFLVHGQENSCVSLMTGWLVSGPSIAVSILLSLKLAEMIRHAVAVWRLPRSFVDRFRGAVVSRQELGSLLELCRPAWDPTRWVFTRHVHR